jgi:hypothetical protein
LLLQEEALLSVLQRPSNLKLEEALRPSVRIKKILKNSCGSFAKIEAYDSMERVS